MKTIVVPTDFSVPAENAVLFAGRLAQKMKASVLLLHVYQIPVSMNDVPLLLVSAEELRKNAEAGLERNKELLLKNYSDVEVKTENRLGDVVTELNDICSDLNPLAIVVGKHGATGIEKLIFGSTSLSIIRHCQLPVIAVPDSATKYEIENIALAIDASGVGEQQDMIRRFVEQMNGHLHIIHVQTNGQEMPDNTLVTGMHVPCQTIKDNEFVRGVQQFTQANNIDLLIILPHRHSLMERLFFKTHTSELVQKLPIPIMCISEA